MLCVGKKTNTLAVHLLQVLPSQSPGPACPSWLSVRPAAAVTTTSWTADVRVSATYLPTCPRPPSRCKSGQLDHLSCCLSLSLSLSPSLSLNQLSQALNLTLCLSGIHGDLQSNQMHVVDDQVGVQVSCCGTRLQTLRLEPSCSASKQPPSYLLLNVLRLHSGHHSASSVSFVIPPY